MNVAKKLCISFVFILLVDSLSAQSIKIVTVVRATTFEKAKITLLNDSVFHSWVSVRSNAYDGYVNHVVYTDQLPEDSNAMISVKDLPVLNHTNLKKIEYANGTAFFFQKLQGCMANCYFLRRVMLENDKVLLTSFMSDDLEILRHAAVMKIPHTVFIQFKTGGNSGKINQLTYIPKMFPNKSKNALAKLFRDHPALKEKIENETFSNNIDGLLQLLTAYGNSQ